MGVIGLSINKIVVERIAPVVGKVNINNNASIKEVHKTELMTGTKKQDALRFVFEFKSNYDPNLAYIQITGDLIWMDKEEQIKELKKQWDDKKQINPDVMTQILNSVLTKCSIEALVLSREMNLPSPIPIPRVQLNNAPAQDSKPEEKKAQTKK